MATKDQFAEACETIVSSAEAGLNSPASSLVGTTIAGQYRLTDLLGTGAKGAVYKAEHLYLKRTVAIKMMHPNAIWDREALMRFHQEAQALSKLDHPNIIGVQQFGVDNTGAPYLVMDYLEGVTLDKLLQLGRLDSADVLQIAMQTCDGLQHAHEQGIFHRDLKPSNILVFRNPENGRWLTKIIDFGLVKQVNEQSQTLTSTGGVLGTPAYMSPETINGLPLDARSDIYGLGCVLYEMLSGELPFKAETDIEMAHRHVNDPPPHLVHGDIWPSLAAIVRKCLQKNTDSRFQSMAELRDELWETERNPSGNVRRALAIRAKRFLYKPVNPKLSFRAMMLVYVLFLLLLAPILYDTIATYHQATTRQYTVSPRTFNGKWYQNILEAERAADKSNYLGALDWYQAALVAARKSEVYQREMRIKQAWEGIIAMKKLSSDEAGAEKAVEEMKKELSGAAPY
jgi:serine/threonine protein kinase